MITPSRSLSEFCHEWHIRLDDLLGLSLSLYICILHIYIYTHTIFIVHNVLCRYTIYQHDQFQSQVETGSCPLVTGGEIWGVGTGEKLCRKMWEPSSPVIGSRIFIGLGGVAIFCHEIRENRNRKPARFSHDFYGSFLSFFP